MTTLTNSVINLRKLKSLKHLTPHLQPPTQSRISISKRVGLQSYTPSLLSPFLTARHTMESLSKPHPRRHSRTPHQKSATHARNSARLQQLRQQN